VEPSRVIFGNIQYGEIIYAIAVVAVAIMVYAFIRRYKMWHLGKEDSRLKGNRAERWRSFLKTAFIDLLIHRKFVAALENLGHRPARLMDLKPREFFPGLIHFLLATGIIMLLISTTLDVVSHYVYDFIKGSVYFAHSLFSDIGGLIALAGVILAFLRRYIQKPERLDNRREDLLALLAIILIVFSGFIVEGFRIAAGHAGHWADSWWQKCSSTSTIVPC
jgi:nitrate reductase gamma subunit